MDRPEKMKGAKSNAYGEGKVDGYNIACDEYEAWLKEAMSVEKIEKIMYKTEDDYELGETNSLHIAIAKEIHKLIGK